jgi:hypothetical protein
MKKRERKYLQMTQFMPLCEAQALLIRHLPARDEVDKAGMRQG